MKMLASAVQITPCSSVAKAAIATAVSWGTRVPDKERVLGWIVTGSSPFAIFMSLPLGDPAARDSVPAAELLTSTSTVRVLVELA